MVELIRVNGGVCQIGWHRESAGTIPDSLGSDSSEEESLGVALPFVLLKSRLDRNTERIRRSACVVIFSSTAEYGTN